jgi:geranylgeranyl diphosphate synthase type II
MKPLKAYLSEKQKLVDHELKRCLPSANSSPATIHQAMRYSIFAGGKRLRPILCLAAAEACGGKDGDALPLAAAVECVHTYSLIHDDLPCMDDDDFRRGKATSHKKFGEGIAVLAGDALLTLAFEIVAKAKASPRYDTAALVGELAVAAGSRKLIAGQVLDLEGEGKGASLTLPQLKRIHLNKTAALLTTSIRYGGMSANATPKRLEALTVFGQSLGLAFQVIDDILDVTQTTEKLGKSAGKDQAVDKATYPSLMGLEKSRKEARKLTGKAMEALAVFGARGQRLREIADYLLAREY